MAPFPLYLKNINNYLDLKEETRMDLVYEVLTVQTALKFVLKSMTYGEELKLKTAIMASDSGITQHFNSILYDSIKEAPEEIKSKDDFLNKITINDRVSLISGLYHATYGDEYITETTCPQCGKPNTNKVSLSKSAKVKIYPKPLEILGERRKVDITINDITTSFILSVPTLQKELNILDHTENLDVDASALNILVHISEVHRDNNVLKLDEKSEKIIDTYSVLQNLPALKVREIKKQIETLNKYIMKVPYKVICSNCKNNYVNNLDFVEQFLRMVLES